VEVADVRCDPLDTAGVAAGSTNAGSSTSVGNSTVVSAASRSTVPVWPSAGSSALAGLIAAVVV
jgi:hypothetical protein